MLPPLLFSDKPVFPFIAPLYSFPAMCRLKKCIN